MKFSQLPDQTRVKLTESTENEFWHRVNEFGGVKNFSQSFEYSASKMYNWKNKDVFLPVDLVKKVFGNEASEGVVAIKGKGRGKIIREPDFPLELSDELLTRVNLSVKVNRNGTPIYQTDDRGNAERFMQLLDPLGEEVPYKIYSRQVYEVQYPKYLQTLLETADHETDLGAKIDEKGEVKDEQIVLPDRELSFEQFDGELFHSDKRLQLALLREDKEEVRELMQEGVRRTRSMF